METTHKVSNAVLGANSKTKLLNSNLAIFNLFSILGALALTSNKNRWPTRTGRGEQKIPIGHGAWCTRSNGSLLQVGASPTSIENWLKITKFEFDSLVFEFFPCTAFDIIYCTCNFEETRNPLTSILGSKIYIWFSRFVCVQNKNHEGSSTGEKVWQPTYIF